MAHPKLIHWNLVVIFVCRILQSRLVSRINHKNAEQTIYTRKTSQRSEGPQHICQTLFLISIFYQYLRSLLATHLPHRNTPYNAESITFKNPCWSWCVSFYILCNPNTTLPQQNDFPFSLWKNVPKKKPIE